MKASSKSATIPGDFSALRFVCGCFGIGEKELTATLERMRSNMKDPDSCFPRTISRVMLMRAEKGKGKWLEPLVTIHCEALYDRIRRDEGQPLFSFAGKVGEEIIITMLNLYRRLRPRLNLKRVSPNDAAWILIEHVIVPSVFVKLAEEWRYGLGTELQGETCWYLPVKEDGNIRKPIARVLDCWLRVAGFRTAYGVSQNLGRRGSAKDDFDDQTDKLWKAWKKSVERWLNGNPVQSVLSLHRLVETFARNVTWLDDANHWKARFTLAYGMQNLCQAMDTRFDAVQKDSSLRLGEMLHGLGEERIVCDTNKLLGGSHSFFAARLLQRRLQKEGKWDEVIARAPKKASRSFPPEASEEEIADYQKQMGWQMNQGNWFLEFIKQQGVAEGRLKQGRNSAVSFVELEEYIFEIGVRELNQLLDPLRKKAGRH